MRASWVYSLLCMICSCPGGLGGSGAPDPFPFRRGPSGPPWRVPDPPPDPPGRTPVSGSQNPEHCPVFGGPKTGLGGVGKGGLKGVRRGVGMGSGRGPEGVRKGVGMGSRIDPLEVYASLRFEDQGLLSWEPLKHRG